MQGIGDLMPYASMDELNRIHQQIKRESISKWNVKLSSDRILDLNHLNPKYYI